MYTGVVDQKCIRNFCRSIGYPIGAPYKLYEYNQDTIKQVLSDRITPQILSLGVFINVFNEYHLRQTFVALDTISSMKMADLNSKPHGVQILRDLVDQAMGDRFYHPSVSAYHKLLRLDKFHNSTHRQIPSNGRSNTNQSGA